VLLQVVHLLALVRRLSSDARPISNIRPVDLAGSIENDFGNALRMALNNETRIDTILRTIESLMSIERGKSSVLQSQRAGFLTFLATILLPFNTVAAVYSMQDRYSPDGSSFWYFWASATGILVVMLFFYCAAHYWHRFRFSWPGTLTSLKHHRS
jgi:Mg2+ and Co2+ transporter CorA